MTAIDCHNADRSLSQTSDGKDWEHYWLKGQYVFSNQIPNQESYTRTHPGWILHDNGKCEWLNADPPPRLYEQASTTEPVISPVVATNMSMSPDGGGGAVLLVLALIASGGIAFWQHKTDKNGDLGYHPMADAPALPTAFTDENLDVISGRVGRPKFQGVSEPDPWQPPADHSRLNHLNPITPEPPEPYAEPVVQVVREPLSRTGSEWGGSGGSELTADHYQMIQREQFERTVLPTVPANGFFLEETDTEAKGTPYWLLYNAVGLGFGKNWCAEHLFKVAKGANSKYQIFSRLYDRVKGELL